MGVPINSVLSHTFYCNIAWPKWSIATRHPPPPLPHPTCHSAREASDSHRPAHSQRPAYWPSWADALQVLGRQASQQAATFLHQFQSEEPPPSIREAAEAASKLQQYGFEPPHGTNSWTTNLYLQINTHMKESSRVESSRACKANKWRAPLGTGVKKKRNLNK